MVTLNSISSTTEVIVKRGNSSDLKSTGSDIDRLSNLTIPKISSFQEIGSLSNLSLQWGSFPDETNDLIWSLVSFRDSLSYIGGFPCFKRIFLFSESSSGDSKQGYISSFFFNNSKVSRYDFSLADCLTILENLIPNHDKSSIIAST